MYARRVLWSHDDLVVAWSACPKESQRYGPDKPVVREVANLLGRSPSAVSRIFGNLWAARAKLQGARETGLSHFGAEIEAVVREYDGRGPDLLSDAERIRALRFPYALAPRLEARVPAALVPWLSSLADLRTEFETFTRSRALTYLRPGSTWFGIVLPAEASLLHSEDTIAAIQKIESGLSESPRFDSGVDAVLRSRLWELLGRGSVSGAVAFTVRRYLADFHLAELDEPDRTKLAAYLSKVEGVRRIRGGARIEEGEGDEEPEPPLDHVRRVIGAALGLDASGLCPDCSRTLWSIVSAEPARRGGDRSKPREKRPRGRRVESGYIVEEKDWA
ncbi:MAG: hypothetical protein WBE40_00855 [Thermoplasmata archaeon]